jgi:hypothetical protein
MQIVNARQFPAVAASDWVMAVINLKLASFFMYRPYRRHDCCYHMMEDVMGGRCITQGALDKF